MHDVDRAVQQLGSGVVVVEGDNSSQSDHQLESTARTHSDKNTNVTHTHTHRHTSVA